MQITLENPDYRYICRGVSAAGVLVNSREITRSFLLGPNVLVENWPLDDMRLPEPAAWDAVLELNPALFVLGTGQIQVFPEPSISPSFCSAASASRSWTTPPPRGPSTSWPRKAGMSWPDF